MNLSSQILSELTIYMKYAKYLPAEKRRESWLECITRNMSMHIKKYPALEQELRTAYKYIEDKKILPSMRSLQFGGKPIEISPNRSYNCSFLPIDHWESFGEIMFLLLGGTGVGYSVQKHHVEQLPEIKKPLARTRRYLINDSIEGWADAVKVLVKAYFFGNSTPVFDFSDIRAKGTPLVTSGGKAPGPQPLKDCLHSLQAILDNKKQGESLTTLECHDMVCHIADAVLSGGIRRAALISLFSMDDEEMLSSKSGDWQDLNPQRARANNSAVILRHKIKKEEFFKFWDRIRASGCGEPGIFFTNDKEWGCNPCGEIALKKNQFCNLVTVNGSDVTGQQDLLERCRAAAFVATVQASYTDFHYLRDVWKSNTEREALIGVSITGIASGALDDLDLEEAAEAVKEENARAAKLLGIKVAARTTTVKPEGTSSLVLGSSSGIHAWFAQYYIRRIRVLKNEAIYKYLQAKLPELIEDDYFKKNIQGIISIPIEAPQGASFENEPVTNLLDRIRRFNVEWVRAGHRKGENQNNVSATVPVKEGEWDLVGKWMWENRKLYNGITVNPYEGGVYKQAPFEAITRGQYEEMFKLLKQIDLSEVLEHEDNTDLIQQVACAGGACELK